MNGFGSREKAFEAKYLHDEELAFRVNIKANQLFALWAARLLGYEEKEAEGYLEEVLRVDFQRTHKDDVLHKVLKDLETAKIDLSEHRVRKELERCGEEARKAIMNNKGGMP